jgi:hypothetical protein
MLAHSDGNAGDDLYTLYTSNIMLYCQLIDENTASASPEHIAPGLLIFRMYRSTSSAGHMAGDGTSEICGTPLMCKMTLHQCLTDTRDSRLATV